MIAIDTNIIVRYLTRDNEVEFKKAYNLLTTHPAVFVASTVILELAWVLESSYSMTRKSIHKGILDFVRLENIEVENPQALKDALELYAAGMDFADAMHIASSGKKMKFFTLDKKFAKKAEENGFLISKL